ncbi:S-adenosylmethionine-dependent methyltransferase family protein [Metarhizium robertsii]|uniref:Methyltransferase domain-containing protein n=2 Tax=Metarhizium robertsii TaxID=568076 RepID=E9FAK0_METRA|nr:methyltransferase domain-containing protein [Metarhizium robertsii ARSEF 23]EFY95250.1 methyltransferase domain-containing protein [Metarhizium robertsii ARSEF 23]EXU96197.1 S-adenosylmethionine-dependent methyltransferase family protein [Metarhizium robertsii]
MDKATLEPAMETGPEKAKASWQEYAYVKDLPDDIAPFKELLQQYSKVPPDKVDELLLRTRDQLWDVFNYPCIGLWTFTKLHSTTDSRFEAATQRLLANPDKPGGTSAAILDIGCCIGQALRHLAHKGVHPSRLYGTDLRPEFIRIGNELFGDEQRGPTFVAGDVLNADDSSLKELDGKVTLIHAAYFFHLFTWDDQVRIGERMVRFLQPGTGDAVVFGRHIGTLRPRELEVPTTRASRCYLHDGESFQRLWDEVGSRTGTRWRVEAEMTDRLHVRFPFFGDDEKYMSFGVYQI